ncbi:MAG: biopolymer transporter ExbD [Verrucomicrobiota bacterium]
MSLRARRQARTKPPVIADINLSPLIDMVFILLIFFVVTTVFVKETGIELERPTSQSNAAIEGENILFAIDEQGRIYFESEQIELSEVGLIVRRLSSREPRPVVIVADRTVTTDELVKVIDEATLAGALSISIATNQNGGQP